MSRPRIAPMANSMRVTVMGSVAAAALLVPANVLADTLRLTDGQVVKGAVETVNTRAVRFLTERAGPIELSHDAVARLDINGEAALATVGGERLIGRIVLSNGRAEIVSRLGAVSVALAEVTEIMPIKPVPVASPKPVDAHLNTATATLSYLSNQTTGFFGETRNGLLSVDLKYERRIAKNTSIGVRIPLYHQRTSTALFEGAERHSALGIGDASVSLSQDINLASGLPQFRLVVHAGIPTGKSAGPDEVAAVGLTSGKWSIGAEVGANLRVGTDVLLGSVGYERYWAAKGGFKGSSTNWMFGYAAMLDPGRQLVLSVNGAAVREDNTLSTPAYGSVSLVQTLSDSVTISPTLAHGLNNDAADFLLAVSVTKSW